MTTTTVRTARYFLDTLRVTIGYGEMLVRDIPAEQFAHMPHPKMNHPAFCLGHLTTYPNRMLDLIGRDDLAIELPGYSELFDAGAECVEQDGRYPDKDALIDAYLERHNVVLDALAETPDDVFAAENPAEGRLREMFPTVGTAVNFLANNHHMMHLGQISGWRRAMGMGPVM